MKKLLLLTTCLCITIISLAQLTAVSRPIIDNMTKHLAYHPDSKMKSVASPKTCNQDTIEYARYKASALVGIGVSNGFSLGQFYEAPDSITVSGATFYGWVISTSNETVEVTISLYEAGVDTLPSGSAIRTKTITLDTTFGGGQLTNVRKHVTFDTPFTTDKPYIITISSSDSTRVGVVCTSYANGDGEQENIACGTVSNVWYRCLNLNIGGTTLDCDILLEPHASYNTYAEFTLQDCYNYQDSLTPINLSSSILKSRMYNRYIGYNLGQYSYYWNYGSGTPTVYGENTKYKLNNPQNRTARLVTTMYGYRGPITCRDTAYQDISYKPSDVTYHVDTPICTGEQAIIEANSNGSVYWYNTFAAVNPIDSGKVLINSNMTTNKQYYTRAINGACQSNITSVFVPLANVPSTPITSSDSICLNAKANLAASSDYGQIYWWSDSIGGSLLHIGDVYITNELTTSETYYAESNNRGCIGAKRVACYANVNASNAPADPITNIDSLVCLHDGLVNLTASSPSNDTIRWFNQPALGTPLSSANEYLFTPQSLGTSYIYVEAFDGQCASTRIQKKIKIWNFPSVTIAEKDTFCQGDTLLIDYSSSTQSMAWYADETSSTKLHDTNSLKLFNLSGEVDYYLQPYSNVCKDTMRHKITINSLNPGTISNIQNEAICGNNATILKATTDAGVVVWFEPKNIEEPTWTGPEFTTPILTNTQKYFVASQNVHCISEKTEVVLEVKPLPNATYNYQVNEIADFTFEAETSNLQYSWDMGDGNSRTGKSVNYKYAKNGNYDVVLTTTGTNNCTNSSSRTIKVAGLTTGLAEHSQSLVSIYPNPASNVLHIDGLLAISKFVLLNNLGEILEARVLTLGENSIDLSLLSLANGFYSVKLISDSGTSSHRIAYLR